MTFNLLCLIQHIFNISIYQHIISSDIANLILILKWSQTLPSFSHVSVFYFASAFVRDTYVCPWCFRYDVCVSLFFYRLLGPMSSMPTWISIIWSLIPSLTLLLAGLINYALCFQCAAWLKYREDAWHAYLMYSLFPLQTGTAGSRGPNS